jgi:hypothetical protein
MRSPRLRITALLVLALAGSATPSAGGECADAPVYSGDVTSPQLAIPGFPDRRGTTLEINAYVEQVAGESGRVEFGTFATSWSGTPLLYALVANEANLQRLDEIVAAQERLRDPRTTSAQERENIARENPAIVWYTGNVHGNETSGADAAVQILYELADRTDCEVRDLLENLVVGIIPIQNPDGRDGFARTNDYAFDMNRDWFAWTQPETRGKVELLSRYPPLLLIDAHEMGSSNFFFPPNADPIHHEISEQSIHWINDLYGTALAAEFEERQQGDPTQWDYFNYDIYDLLYMGYGDSMPTTAFTAAGMTFEKGTADTDRQRWLEQFVAGWTSLGVAAEHREEILGEYYEAHATAVRDGRRGRLEPNQVFQEGNEVARKVPGEPVRHYFIQATRALPSVTSVIRHLLEMDVEVHRLTAPLRVRGLREYGRAAEPGRVPKGSYWIPMAQPQKRWIQAMLGEDPYVPFPYFYDVTAWSLPLLANLDASFTGDRLSPRSVPVTRAPGGRVVPPTRGSARFYWFDGESADAVAAALALAGEGVRIERLTQAARTGGQTVPEAAFIAARLEGLDVDLEAVARRYGVVMHGSSATRPGGPAVRLPKIAVYTPPGLADVPAASLVGESLGHLLFFLEQELDLTVDLLTGPQVALGGLTLGEYDVFIVPGVPTVDLTLAQEQIRLWIEQGGRYIGTARPGATGGTPFAVSSGYTSATLSTEAMQVPGTMFRVALDGTSPLALGAGDTSYWYHLGEDVLAHTTTGRNAAVFPKRAPDFWFSGYASGVGALRGSVGLVEETLGSGRVILFSGEPNFRAYTDGMRFLLANAIAYPEGSPAPGIDLGSPEVEGRVAAAQGSVGPTIGPGRPIRIEVALADAQSALEVLRRFTSRVSVQRAGGSAFLQVPNPQGFAVDSHPFAYQILPSLRAAGVRVLSAIL